MGFNTAVVFYNDVIDELRTDPLAGEKVYRAVVEGRSFSGRGDGYFQYGQALDAQHADVMQVITVGHNSIKMIGSGYYSDDTIQLLKRLADQHGYRLVKKRTK